MKFVCVLCMSRKKYLELLGSVMFVQGVSFFKHIAGYFSILGQIFVKDVSMYTKKNFFEVFS